MSQINIKLDDAQHGLSIIEDNSIDLIILDPPYNIGKGDWDKIDNYIEWIMSIYKECERVLKPTGSFYWFHNDFEVISEIQYLLKRETSFVFRNLLIWNKKFPDCKSEAYMDIAISTNKNRTYRKFAEYCLFYTFKDVTDLDYSHIQLEVYKPIREYFREVMLKSNKSWNDKEVVELFQANGFGKNYANARQLSQNKLNPNYSQFRLLSEKEYDFLKGIIKFEKSYEELKVWWEQLNTEYRKLRASYKIETKNLLKEKRYVFNKQKNHSVTNYQTPEDKLHVCEKPLEMIEDIIRTSSDENDLVLDCFVGSGTTPLACKNTNRNFVGFENDKKTFEIAIKRVNE